MNGDYNPGDEAPLNPKPLEDAKPHHSPHQIEGPKKTEKRTRPWFQQWVPYEYRGRDTPNDIIKYRNVAIVALSIQIASVLAGFAFYGLQRKRLLLIVNIITVLIMINGWWGVLCLSRWNAAIHGVFTSAVIGVFFLFSILEALFREDLGQGDGERYSDRGVLVLLSLPYFVDFLAGLVTFYLTYLLFKEQERRDTLERIRLAQEEPEIELPEDYDEGSNMCIICFTKEKNTVMYPCGHKVLCIECSKAFKSRSNKKCPMCRAQIKDVIAVYS